MNKGGARMGHEVKPFAVACGADWPRSARALACGGDANQLRCTAPDGSFVAKCLTSLLIDFNRCGLGKL
jgi:hypothetical protein